MLASLARHSELASRGSPCCVLGCTSPGDESPRKSPRAQERLGDRRTAGIRRAAVWNARMEWKLRLCSGGRLLNPSRQSWKSGVEGDKGRWGDRGYITKGFCTLSSRRGWYPWRKSWCERRVRLRAMCASRAQWRNDISVGPERVLLLHASVPQESDRAGRRWGIEGTALRGDCPAALPGNSDFGLCTSATSASWNLISCSKRTLSGPTLMSFLHWALEAVTWSWDLSLPFHKVILGTMLKFSKPSNPQMWNGDDNNSLCSIS